MSKVTSIRIGDCGQTATRLSPSGIVTVNGQRHSARSVNTVIESGQNVVVLNGDLHGFVVRPVSDDFDIASIPNLGRVVQSNFGDSIQATNARSRETEQLWLADRAVWQHRVGPRLGVLFATTGAVASWNSLTQSLTANQIATLLGVLLFASPIAGALLLRFVDHSLDQIDTSLRRFAFPTTVLSLAGGTSAAVFAIPAYGLWIGAFLSIVATAVAGFPLPALMALASASADASPLEGVDPQVMSDFSPAIPDATSKDQVSQISTPE